jgi:hypothetical protein
MPEHVRQTTIIMTNKPSSTTSGWSFNFRSTNLDFYSDSDSDADSVDIDETRLINDLDLSSREETVLYKPNPFSIAKINAASRIHGVGTGVTFRQQPTKEKTSLKLKAPQQNLEGNIIDGFKKQAERSQGQSLSVGALKPGLVTSKRAANELEGGTPAKKTINCSLPAKTAISTKQSKSVASRALFVKSKTAIRPGARVNSSTTTIAQMSPAINLESRRSRGPSPSVALSHERHHDMKLAGDATPCTAFASPSHPTTSIPPNPRHEQTHIPTHTSTPDHQFVLPVTIPQSQDSQTSNPTLNLQQSEFQLQPSNPFSSSLQSAHDEQHFQGNGQLSANNPISRSLDYPNLAPHPPSVFGPTSRSSSSMFSTAQDIPRSHDALVLTQVPPSTAGPDKHKPKFRPQNSGPFSSPVLPPTNRFLPSTRFQDNVHANAPVFRRIPIPVPMPFSSPIRPSDSYTNTPSAGALPGSRVFTDTPVFPPTLNFVPSRVGFSQNGPSPQPQPQPRLRSRLGTPFKYGSQQRPQDQILEHISPTNGS